MPKTDSAAAQAAAPTQSTITLGEREHRIERISARKAARAFAELRAITRAVPEINKAVSTFVRTYEEENVVELDRVQAKMRFGAETIDTLTEEDWANAGGKLRLPRSPGTTEVILAAFPIALDLAEAHVYRLLALFLMPNEDVARYRKNGELDERLGERADDLLDDAYGDEVMELAVVVGELVDRQFVGKARELGDRLGNALRLVGLGPATPTTPTASRDDATGDPAETSTSSESGPSASKPTSSTSTPAPTDGSPTPSSTSPTSSSPSSDTASTSTSSPPSKPASKTR